MTEILHIRLEERGQSARRLIYYRDNHLDEERSACFQLQEIEELILEARGNYYQTLDPNSRQFGQRLFTWLDHQTGVLKKLSEQFRHDYTVLAISGDDGLADLPWEILHDGQEFLVNKTYAIIPVRWLGDREILSKLSINNETDNRPLNILFMATSPTTREEQLKFEQEEELEFEQEESSILDATDNNAFLVVEESGCLTELEELVRSYRGQEQYFDIFHLTGHGVSQYGQFYFLTEDEFGYRVDSTEQEIARALTVPLPKLIFLSGCESANMARNLVRKGATATLGWGKKVEDWQASLAASEIYKILSSGQTLIEALARTYQFLIDSRASDWHMLRMYIGNELPSAFVTSIKHPGRKPIPIIFQNIDEFDEEGNLISIPRENFVGRRRVLQKCLRVLKRERNKVGVFLQGGGGLGKTAIALRLWNRLPDYIIIHIRQQIKNESILINKIISNKYLSGPNFIDLRNYLISPNDTLESKLQYLLNELRERGKRPFLFILDDFEWNCHPPRESEELRFPLEQKADEILSALVLAVKDAGYRDRIIITSRYRFDSKKKLLKKYFYERPIDSFRKTTLKKKLRRLKFFNSNDIDREIKQSAKKLADGNPRLLEFLDKELANLPQDEIQEKIRGYRENSDIFREQIIWDDLYEQLEQSSGKLRKVLSNCLIFEIPVPRDAFEAVCSHGLNFLDLSPEIERGINAGLIEETDVLRDNARLYRIHRILPQTISSVRLPEAPDVYSLYRKAHDKLHELWGNKENESEEKWREIFRLLFADKENPKRFREGFSQMLAVKYNPEADSALELELRRLKDELPEEISCYQLEDYLRQGDWRKADEETAWLFYLVMVQQGYKDWDELCEQFPIEILNEIDRLWVKYSQGRFGFSIQKQILESVRSSLDSDLFIEFAKKVQWYKETGWWRDYDDIMSFSVNDESPQTPECKLPLFLYTRRLGLARGGWGNLNSVGPVPDNVPYRRKHWNILYMIHRASLLSHQLGGSE